MVVDWRCGAIFLVVFRWVSIGIVKLWNFELVDAGEEHIIFNIIIFLFGRKISTQKKYTALKIEYRSN